MTCTHVAAQALDTEATAAQGPGYCFRRTSLIWRAHEHSRDSIPDLSQQTSVDKAICRLLVGVRGLEQKPEHYQNDSDDNQQ